MEGPCRRLFRSLIAIISGNRKSWSTIVLNGTFAVKTACIYLERGGDRCAANLVTGLDRDCSLADGEVMKTTEGTATFALKVVSIILFSR